MVVIPYMLKALQISSREFAGNTGFQLGVRLLKEHQNIKMTLKKLLRKCSPEP